LSIELRNFGYRILQKSKNCKDAFCLALDYSESDYQRLISGRLLPSCKDMDRISEFFSDDADKYFDSRNEDSYPDRIHMMSKFSVQSNCDFLLNLIDSYIDVKDAVDRWEESNEKPQRP